MSRHDADLLVVVQGKASAYIQSPCLPIAPYKAYRGLRMNRGCVATDTYRGKTVPLLTSPGDTKHVLSSR